MIGWILRRRWPLVLGALLVVLASLAVAVGAAWTLLAMPWLTAHNPAVACAWTTLAHDRLPFTVLPQVRWRAPLGGRCAPRSVQHTALLVEEIGGGLLLARLLLGRTGRHMLRSLWFWVQGVGRLVPGTTHGRARWSGCRELRAFRERWASHPTSSVSPAASCDAALWRLGGRAEPQRPDRGPAGRRQVLGASSSPTCCGRPLAVAGQTGAQPRLHRPQARVLWPHQQGV